MQSVPVRCPHCGKPNLVPSAAAGTALRCPYCGAAYLAPPLPVAVVSATRPAAPLPPHLVRRPIATATPEQPAAQIEPAPYDNVGASTSHSPPRGRKLIAMLYAVVFCTLLGILAVTAGILVVAINKRSPTSGEAAGSVDDSSRTAGTRHLPWISAEKPVVRDDVRVKIIGIEYGPVLGRNASNESIESGSGEFIKVYLRIENRGNRRVQYTSWYRGQFVEAGQKVSAKLIDSDDHSWPLQRFPGVERIQGHTPQIELTTGERADDVLIFAAPESLLSSGQPLRLSLPAGAIARQFGPQWHAQAGFYRFEIPASMLSGERTSED